MHPRYWLSWAWLVLMRLLSHLPLQAIWFLGAVVGMILYALHAGRRHVARRNLERCFPQLGPTQCEQLVRRHFRVLGQTLLDNGIAWWASKRRLKRLFRIRGREHYDRALARFFCGGEGGGGVAREGRGGGFGRQRHFLFGAALSRA